jgi:hypothetical protein
MITKQTTRSSSMAGPCRKMNTCKKNHNIGLELLQRIKKIEAGRGGKEKEAMSLIYSGDWETLFGNETQVLKFYQQGFQALLAAGIGLNRVKPFLNDQRYFLNLQFTLGSASFITCHRRPQLYRSALGQQTFQHQ